MACTYLLPGKEDIKENYISQPEFKAYLANGGLEELYPGVKFDYSSKTESLTGKQAEDSGGKVKSQAEQEPSKAEDQSTVKDNKTDNDKITDFGEKLGGAKKDRIKSIDTELSNNDIINLPLSKIWPKSDIDDIEDNLIAAIAKSARDEIPNKPKTSYKVKRWAEKVIGVRDLIGPLLRGTVSIEKFRELIEDQVGLKDFAAKYELLNVIDRSQWDRIDRVNLHPDAYRFKKDTTDSGVEKIPAPYVSVNIDGKNHSFDGAKTIADVIDKVNLVLGVEQSEKKMAFEIRGRGESYFINKKGDTEYRKLKQFTSVDDARKFLKDNYADLVKAWDDVKNRDNVKEKDLRNEENRPRSSEDYRNGKDITPEKFQETFGFRGIEFGNWVSQGKNPKERQGMLNEAYDALMDLAKIIDIPPKAISLNGSLGVGFGSRGAGWASAHYEPGNVVINLTKTRGAGSLAHEWFHALDNYFSRLRGVKEFTGDNADYRKNNYVTYKPEPMYVHKNSPQSSMTKAELEARRKFHPESGWYKADNWQLDPNHKEGVRPEVERKFAELVEALNESPMAKRSKVLDKTNDKYWSQIIERAARSFENYVISKMQDQGYHNDYLANVVPENDFGRNIDRYPYLLDSELAPVKEAFDNLFDTIETKETDKGTALYSQSQSQVENPHTEASLLQSMRKVFDAKFGSNWVDRLLATGKFKIVSRKDAAKLVGKDFRNGTVQGFYNPKDDVTYLVAENISKDDDLYGLVNHEIAVHALQLGKNDKEFKAILTQLEQMRDFGNKKVVDAFGRVPKDTKAEHITEEALAYLVQYHPQLGIVKRLLAWFRQAIRKIGKALPAAQKLAIYNYASKLTTDDIAYMAENALRTAPDSLVFDNIGNADDSVRTSFAGQNAQTADKYQLSTAQERLNNGDDAEQVRKDTGWFQGADGKWRFEIDDSDAKLKFRPDMGTEVYLFEMLDHPALFAAYPSLYNTSVSTEYLFDKGGSWSRQLDTITIDAKLSNKQYLSVILHEIQHAIQDNEGFARGGSKNQFETLENILEKSGRDLAYERYDDFVRSIIGDSWGMFVENTYDEYDYDEDLAKSKIKEAEDKIDAALKDNPYMQAQVKILEKNYKSPEQLYRDLAGEVEARNVQARQNLTAEQRKNTPIESTQDTPNSDVIVMYNGKEMHSAPANMGDDDDIRFSIASPITDRAKQFINGTNIETPRSLDEFNQILQSGRMPERHNTWSDTADKLVEMFADATRPFDVWARQLPDIVKTAQLVMAKDRAVERKKAFEKEIMIKFGDEIGKSVRAVMVKAGRKDYQATKEMVGHWMTARYAQIANKNLLNGYKEKEQEAFKELDAFNNNPDPLMTASEIAGEKDRLLNALNSATKKVNQFEAAMNSPDIIDPTVQKHEIGLAGGYNNATAKQLMSDIERIFDRNLIEKVANHVYAMNAYKLQQDIKNGKVTQEIADKFDKSGFYVPLTGDPRNDDSTDDFFTTGNLNQQSDKRMQGRQTSLAKNGIDASFEQVEKSARYHGWVDFKDKLTEVYDDLVKGFIDDYNNEKEAIKKVTEEYGISRHAERQGQRTSDDGIIVRKGDSVWVYDLNNKAAIDALRSINHEETPTLLKPVAFFNAWNSRFITQFMPFFAIKNALMDTFERSENIRARTIPGYDNVDMNLAGKRTLAIASTQTMKLLKKIMSISALGTPLEGGVNFLGMKMDLTVDYSDPETLSILEFLNEGGASTWGDYLNTDSKGLSEKLEKIGTWRKGAMDVVHVWNQSFDLISGYAVYKALREQNVDVKTAATTSLNLFNFSKRGRVMSPIRALYMFAQPAATSAHQLAMSLKTKRGQYRFYAYTIAGFMLYSLLRSGDDDDELGVNNMDELGNFSLYRNIPIPLGDGVYAKIPVGFGLPQLAWSTAVNLAKFTQGNQSAGETLGEMVYGAIKIASPVAPSDTSITDHPAVWFMQSISPQPFKGIANVSMDVNAFGNALTNAKFSKENKAKALQGRKTTPEEYKMFAQEMAKLGFDVYPEEVREIARTYMPFPVVFNTLIKQFIENPSREARGKQTVSPFVDRWVLAQDDDALKEKLFYRYIARVNDLSAEASVGSKLTPEEAQLAELGDEINHRINQANGKMAAATKAEKDGKSGKAKLLKLEADRLRDKNMEYLIRQYTKIAA